MQIEDRTIEEFRVRYSEEFGEQISKQEAYERFLRLVNFLRVEMKYPEEN